LALPSTKNRLRGRESAAFKPSCVAEIILCVVCKKIILLYISMLMRFAVWATSAKNKEKGGFQVIFRENFSFWSVFWKKKRRVDPLFKRMTNFCVFQIIYVGII
jgi:hypothetical protein